MLSYEKNALRRGDDFCSRLDRIERPLCVLAHHDDEVGIAGLLQRLGPSLRLVWTTNSDGRYFDSDLNPPLYGELRKAEGLAAVAAMGMSAERTACLDFSEVEIYRRMSALHGGTQTVNQALPLFQDLCRAVREQVFQTRPDLVVTLAWQGGQPEHDLTHFATHLALQQYRSETGQQPIFLHFPAYEYTYALAMRFHPLYEGVRLRISLSEQEMETKANMVQAYPSQVSLFKYFRWAFAYLFKPLGWLTGGPKSIEDFLGIEEFGPVPCLDYLKKPHLIDYCTYMFDDFEGVPVSFMGSIRPLIKGLLEQSP